MPDSVAANLETVRQTIARSAERAGRDPHEVALVAVTKTFPVERIREALAVGLRTLGENRVQEALPKIEEIGPANVDWHLIGHLQTNKVKFIEGRFRMVQSLDGVALAEALDHRLQSPLDVLVEVNVAEEPQKTGVLPADLAAVAAAVNGAARSLDRAEFRSAERHQFPAHLCPGPHLSLYLCHLRAGCRVLVHP